MRRGFGRPLRRVLSPDIPPLLRRANQMLSAGNYAEAASAFEQLARAAEARGGPRGPPFLYLQAGRSRVMAGQTAQRARISGARPRALCGARTAGQGFQCGHADRRTN